MTALNALPSVLSSMPTTRLYPIVPHGVGSVEVESLTSYLRRLAGEHAVSVGSLLLHEVLGPRRRDPRQGLAIKPAQCGESINGVRPTTRSIVETLETFTGIPSIHETTALGRDDVVALWRSFREDRAWCPACLAQTPAYDRLLWSFRAVSICPRHERALARSCPRCTRAHRPWHPALTARRCPFCGADLADATPTPSPIDPLERAAHDVLGLILTGQGPARAALAYGAVALIGRVGWATASRGNGIGKSTLRGIRAQTLRPELDVVCRLITASGETTGAFLAHPAVPVRSFRHQRPRSGQRRPPAVDLAPALRSAIVVDHGSVVSVRAFGRAHGISSSALRYHWPRLARGLSAAYRRQQSRADQEPARAGVRARARGGEGGARAGAELPARHRGRDEPTGAPAPGALPRGARPSARGVAWRSLISSSTGSSRPWRPRRRCATWCARVGAAVRCAGSMAVAR